MIALFKLMLFIHIIVDTRVSMDAPAIGGTWHLSILYSSNPPVDMETGIVMWRVGWSLVTNISK